MAKTVHNKTGKLLDTALIAVGWIAFILGIWIKPHFPVYALCLSAVARVLP
jgi:CHASE2 domain-containing sensor protein